MSIPSIHPEARAAVESIEAFYITRGHHPSPDGAAEIISRHYEPTLSKWSTIAFQAQVDRFMDRSIAVREMTQAFLEKLSKLKPKPSVPVLRLVFAWYDLWVGAYYDRKNSTLYIFPVPMVGIAIQLGRRKGVK